MKYHLKITDEAADRLLSTAKWYAETSQSVQIATQWYDGFLHELETLESDPYRGPIAADNRLFGFELRELHYGSGKRLTHRALYRIAEDTVDIRHLAQRPLESGEL